MTQQEIRQEKQRVNDILRSCLFDCQHAERVVRKLLTKDGHIQLREQCRFCGTSTSDPLPQKNYSKQEVDSMEEYDREIRDKRGRVFSHFYEALSHFIDMKYGGSWWNRYERHLSSDKWQNLRQTVIARANNICELCGKQKVEHVHHTNYDNFGDEAAEDLLGVCSNCHSKLHSGR